MASFGSVNQSSKKPSRIVIVPPSIFKDTWRDRPTDDVAIGLRIPADIEVSAGRAEAARLAVEYHPDDGMGMRIDCYNDALFREICALGMCDVNDVTAPYFPNPEDDARTKLTSPGAKFLFDEIERMSIETSPVHREASDEEAETLGELLSLGGVGIDLPEDKAKRARRLIAFLLDELMGTTEV